MLTGTFDRQEQFSAGDVVTLKTGGARMTIMQVGAADEGSSDWLLCQWFDDRGELCQEQFAQDALARVPRSISPGLVHLRWHAGLAGSRA